MWGAAPRGPALGRALLLSIAPPSSISRAPRSLGDGKYWKASEYRSWLFYYVMSSLLTTEYHNHFAVFCHAIYILNSSSISLCSLKRAKKLLRYFYFTFTFPTLYGERYLTLNMHQLLHLTDSVKYLGPLHTFSCFDHEHSNGLLTKTVHSNCGVDKQIMSMFSYLQGMCRLSSENNVQEEWIDNILYFSRSSSKGGIALLGSCDTVDNSLLESYFTCTPSQIKRYKRMRTMHEVYHSTLYERPTK